MDSDHFLSILGLLGGFAGVFTLGWRLLDVFRAYLHIDLTLEKLGERRLKLRTIVQNKNSIYRKLDSAFLLIGPADETPDDTVRTVFKYNDEPIEFKNLNQMVRVVTNLIKRDPAKMQDDAGRLLIPLPYYFVENFDVADENLSYEQIIFCDQLPRGVYASRFYIETIPRLHRVVHAAFEVTSNYDSV
jgi:hypothetical protein